MAFAHSKQSRVYVNGYNLSTFLKSGGFSASGDPADVTSLADQSIALIPGFQEGTMTLEGMFAGEVDEIHDILKTAFNAADSVATHLPYGDAHGNHVISAGGIEVSYEVNSEVGDLVSVSAEIQADSGVDFGRVLHALEQRDANGNGTSINNGALSEGGGVAYLHVTDVTGAGNLVVKVQDSEDNLAWADIVTFATVTADHKKERVELSGDVRQYIRATWDIGALTDATFHVNFARL